MPCQLQRDKEDRQSAARQYLPAAASVHRSEPRVAQGAFRHLIGHKDTAGLLLKSQKENAQAVQD